MAFESRRLTAIVPATPAYFPTRIKVRRLSYITRNLISNYGGANHVQRYCGHMFRLLLYSVTKSSL